MIVQLFKYISAYGAVGIVIAVDNEFAPVLPGGYISLEPHSAVNHDP